MGLLEITIEAGEPAEGDKPLTTEADNTKAREFVMDKWMLGPEKTAGSNGDYWREMATVWRTSPDQAKRMLCANCKYFNDTPEMLESMESVPQDKFDKDGGGRGWCNKFEFVCHHQRTCKAWEAGSGNKGAVVNRKLNESNLKLAGWDEIDKYSVDELIGMGFDGVKMADKGQPTMYQIFNPEKLKK